jgi:LysR family nitrogen assimilation transcriptional regulator
MNSKQLEIFLKVAELGSLSRAAVSLGRTQPILSKNIKDLEQDVGTTLFHRTGRGLQLTESGKLLLGRATRIFDEIRQAELDIRNLGQNQLSEATIAFPTIMSSMLLKPLVSKILSRHPHIRLRIREGTSGPIMNWVVNRQVDVAILYDTMPLQPDAMQMLYKENLYLVGLPGLAPLADTTTVDQLEKIPLILPGPNESLRIVMEMAAAQRGVRLKIVVEGDSYNTVRLLIEDGRGYGVLPRFALLPELQKGTLRASRLIKPDVTRTVVLTTCSNKVPPAGLKELAAIVKTVLRDTIEKANAA